MKGYSIAETARKTGYSLVLINKKIWNGEIVMEDRCITEETMERIMDEKAKYVSFAEFVREHSGDIDGKLKIFRAKLYDYLVEADYFGLVTVSIEDILMATDFDVVFFRREDIPILEENLEEFIRDYGLTVSEKVDALIDRHTATHPEACMLLRTYIRDEVPDTVDYPPTFTDFVSLVLSMPDVPLIKTEDIADRMKDAPSMTCREHAVKFLNYCRDRTRVRYSQIRIKRKESKPAQAYSSEQYIEMMRCVFNAGYIAEHRMIEKALSNHLYAETWLYTALFLTCGWRAADICDGWQYPHLAEKKDLFPGIDRDTLMEDVLHDRIKDEVYESVCRYCIASVEAAEMLPGKTWMRNPVTLRDVITPELHTFYGMLTLIGEAMVLQTGDGYLNRKRKTSYQNKRNLEEFFGPGILIPLEGRNLESRRLNKVFLQGVEKASRQNGNSGLMASAVASYARNHTSMDTITSYLHDHNMDGETAEAVLYFMMERGVFGFEYYRTLLTAYPDAFTKLTMKSQNRLIALMEESPLVLETAQAGKLAQMEIRTKFEKEGDGTGVISMMRAMLEISQTRGKGKDNGVHCLKRAMGEACAHPEYDSCLANACPHLVFTRHAIIPLARMLKGYMAAAEEDRKSEAVLKEIIVPRFQKVINAVMQEMEAGERAGIKKLIAETLRETG